MQTSQIPEPSIDFGSLNPPLDISPSLAVKDPERLAALKRTSLMDTPAEESFDRLTRLARRILNVPVALVSLVDDHRQFFKSAQGLAEPWASLRETPLSHSFCQHVVTRHEPLIVDDARTDPLVCQNLAVNELGVIAYAGVPLVLPNGYVLGAFAAIDSAPRVWSADDISTLKDLAAAVLTEAELRMTLTEAKSQTGVALAAERQLRTSEFRLRVLCDIMADSTTTFDQKMDSILWMGCQQFGLQFGLLGEVVKPEAGMSGSIYRVLRSVALAGTPLDSGYECPMEETLCHQGVLRNEAFCLERMEGDAQKLYGVAYDRFKVQSFIGAPVPAWDEEGHSGSLCFYSRQPRYEPFTLADREFVRLVAQWVSSEMARRQSEMALQESRERYELAVDGSRDGIWDWDIVMNRVIYSARWKAMLGYEQNEFPNATEVWEGMLHPEDRPRVLALMQMYLSGRVPEYEVEYRLRHRDGSYRWILARGMALRDESGIPYRMAGSHTDITERKEAEAALRRERDFTTAVVDTAGALVVVLDTEGRIVRFNLACEITTGLSFEEVRGRYFWDVVSVPEEREQSQEIFRKLAGGDFPSQNESHWTTRGGKRRYISWANTALLGDDGKVQYVVGTGVDITARRDAEEQSRRLTQVAQEARERAEEASARMEVALEREKHQAALLKQQSIDLARARDEAIQHTRAKSEFLANMSHEIRTPMNGVIGMTNLLMDTRLTPAQRDFAENIRTSATALLTVINDILDFSKIESGKLMLNEADFDLCALVEEAAALLAPTAHAKGLEVTCRVTPPGKGIALRGDDARLRQILMNLLGNAVKFTETGNVGIEASVIPVAEGRATVRLAITDTGIGIPKDRQNAIFESFVQADGSTTRRFGGTGLGLTITRQLVELMGGHVTLESESGKGSTFRVEVTLATGNPAAISTESHAAAEAIAGRRLLVVDDNAINRRILQEQLTAWGCRVDLASSGEEALIRMGVEEEMQDPYDAVLLDMQMPEMDGHGTALRIRADNRFATMPLLLLSSGVESDTPTIGSEDAGKKPRFAATLAKPLRQGTLLATLHAVLLKETADVSTGTLIPATAKEGDMAQRNKERLSGLQILLAEDNVVNQKVATHLLQKWDCRVVVAGSGVAALAAVAAAAEAGKPFDAVLMDVQMPEMDGLTATGNLRSRGALAPDGTRRLPVIALTAHSMQGDRERCLEAGMDDYLSKPLREDDLCATLLRWCPRPEAPVTVAASSLAPTQSSGAAFPERDEQNGEIDGRAILQEDRLWECCAGDRELVVEVGQEFLRTLPIVMDRLRAAVLAKDAEKVRFESHTLRGSCRTVGADAMEFLCGEMEQQSASGDLTGVPEWFAQTEAVAERLAAVLAAIIR